MSSCVFCGQWIEGPVVGRQSSDDTASFRNWILVPFEGSVRSEFLSVKTVVIRGVNDFFPRSSIGT